MGTDRSRSLAVLLTALLAACGGAAPDQGRFDAAALRAERGEAGAGGEAVVWLRRSVQVTVGTARRASEASSRLRIRLAVARFGEAAQAPLDVPLLTPPIPGVPSVTAWGLPGGEPERLPATPTTRTPRIDPEQAAWTFRLPPGELTEVVIDVEIPGTLRSDARWLAMPEGPTREVLVRYDLPDEATGVFQVRDGPGAKPLVTRRRGTTIIAFRLADVKPWRPGAAHVRYATRRTRVRGYKQALVTDWASVAGAYTAELVERSRDLRDDYVAPWTPGGSTREDVVAAWRWVRDRIQRDDALEARWDAGRSLPARLANNDLTGTDKVHVLHWILEAAGVPHRVAVARGGAWPDLDPAFPVAGAFEHALLYVPAHDLWLDPACLGCEPGQLRPALRGGQALLLPADGEQPRPLPAR